MLPLCEIDLAGVRPPFAGHDIHHRSLAGAVRADDGAHLARVDHEREFVKRLEAVERHADAIEVKQRGGCRFLDHSPYSAACGTAPVSVTDLVLARLARQYSSVPTIDRKRRR